MSDLMLFGILRMPYDMAMGDDLSRVQFHAAVQRAADALEAKDAEIERLCNIVETQEDALREFYAEIERLNQMLKDSSDTVCDLENSERKLQAVIDSFPKLPGREWTSDQILIWLEQVHDWKKAALEAK